MFENLLQKIKTLLETNDLLQRVYDYETSESDGFPFATITPSANESDYASTTENRRTYAFNIRLFAERAGQTSAGPADLAMRELVDSTLDLLDSNYTLSGTTAKTGYTVMFSRATPSIWGYAGGKMEYRVAEIKIQVIVLVDVNEI